MPQKAVRYNRGAARRGQRVGSSSDSVVEEILQRVGDLLYDAVGGADLEYGYIMGHGCNFAKIINYVR